MNQQLVVLFAPAIAWGMLWVQFVVIKFYGKRDELYKDSSKDRDLAVGNIEAKNLVPALAALVAKVVQLKDESTQKGANPSYEELLNAFAFKDYLERAESAAGEISTIVRCAEALSDLASRLWKLALLHVLSVVLIPTCIVTITDEKYRIASTTVVTVIAVISLIFTLLYLVRFEKKNKWYLNALEKHRGKGNA